MENNLEQYEYNNENIVKTIEILNQIPTKEGIPQSPQEELNKMSKEVRSNNTRLRIEETKKRDQEPGVYITRVIQLKDAIMKFSRTDIKKLLSFSCLYDDVLQHLFEKSEELGGKDFIRNDEHKEEYYQQFIDYIRPNEVNNQTKDEIIAIL